MTQVTFSLNDNTYVTTQPSNLKKSNVLRDMTNFCNTTNEPVVLPMDSFVFEKVLQYLIHYKDTELIDLSFNMDLINTITTQGILVPVIVAADFLDIQKLLDITCEKAGSLIYGKKPNEIKGILGISNEIFDKDIEIMTREWEYIRNL
jgi:hypothetical protein